MPRIVNPGFDSEDTRDLPLFAGIGGCDATVPAVLKLEAGPGQALRSMPAHAVIADEVPDPPVHVASRLPVDVADALRRGEKINMIPPFVTLAPYSNPTTSREAAADITPKLGDLEELVLEAIRASCDGLTCDEVETYAGLSHQCASARIRGLVLKGKLKDSERTRKTRSGRSAIVWVTA